MYHPRGTSFLRRSLISSHNKTVPLLQLRNYIKTFDLKKSTSFSLSVSFHSKNKLSNFSSQLFFHSIQFKLLNGYPFQVKMSYSTTSSNISETNNSTEVNIATAVSSSQSQNVKECCLDRPSNLAKQIFMEAVESVKPSTLLKNKVTLTEDKILHIDDDYGTRVDLKKIRKIFVVGFGKAVLGMGEEILKIFGSKNVERCFVNIPVGFRDSNDPKIEINRGATNNIPDKEAFQGSQKLVEILKTCQPDDLLIVLITGGGSALLPYPITPITIQEKGALIRDLSRAGASIQEINSVRKRLSLVKGGGLINLTPCCTILSLILSDVLGDPLGVIASGPTVLNSDPENLAKEIVEKYLLPSSVPVNIKTVLKSPMNGISVEDKSVTNSIIGTNLVALKAGAKTARDLTLYPIIVTNKLSGEASRVGGELANLTMAASYIIEHAFNKRDSSLISSYSKAIRKAGENMQLEGEVIERILTGILDPKVQTDFEGICLLFGGETTVTVKGNGVGGRNQELALKAAAQIDASFNNEYVKEKIAILSGGTDGFDGPCDAAGAVVNSNTVRNGYSENKKLSPYQHLLANDSYNYFNENSEGAYHIKTGHTETNVMDLVIIVVVK